MSTTKKSAGLKKMSGVYYSSFGTFNWVFLYFCGIWHMKIAEVDSYMIIPTGRKVYKVAFLVIRNRQNQILPLNIYTGHLIIFSGSFCYN